MIMPRVSNRPTKPHGFHGDPATRMKTSDKSQFFLNGNIKF